MTKGLRRSRIRGFTLVELLIVVVIIAILAALFLPRLLAQPERAVIAEANNFLGVLRRAQMTNQDTTNAATWNGAACNPAALPCAATWAQLGLQDLTPQSNFSYTCTAAGAGDSCTATRRGGSVPTAVFVGATVTLNDAGVFTCGGPVGGAAYRLAGNTCVSP